MPLYIMSSAAPHAGSILPIPRGLGPGPIHFSDSRSKSMFSYFTRTLPFIIVHLFVLVAAVSGLFTDESTPANTELGQYPSLQLYQGSNAVTIIYGSQYGLKIASCSETRCREPRISHVGCSPPLASSSLTFVTDGASEVPFMAYATREHGSNSVLHAMSCSDQVCLRHESVLIDGPNAGYACSVNVRTDRKPVISYFDSEHTRIGIASCLDTRCSQVHKVYPSPIGGLYGSWGSTDVLLAPSKLVGQADIRANVGDDVGDDILVVSFQRWDSNGTAGSLQLVVCEDALCNTNYLRTVDSSAAEFSSLTLDGAGRVLMAFVDSTYTILRFARCEVAGCSSGDITKTDLFSSVSHHPLSFPVIRVDPWSDRPVIAFFKASSSGGELRVLSCRSPDCSHVSSILDSVVVDQDPEWSTSDMQISMQIGSDGRPVIAYSVYKPPSISLLKVAVCDSPGCFYSTVYVMDAANVEPQLRMEFNAAMLAWTELLMVVILLADVSAGRYYRNRARLVNAYTLMAFTSSVVVHTQYRRAIRVCLLFSFIGALLSSVSWLLYCPGEVDVLLPVLIIVFVPVAAVLIVCIALSFPTRVFLMVAGFCSAGSLVLLDVAIMLVLNLHAFECNSALNTGTPRSISMVGFFISSMAILVSLFLATRVYTAVKLAKPDGRVHDQNSNEHMLD